MSLKKFLVSIMVLAFFTVCPAVVFAEEDHESMDHSTDEMPDHAGHDMGENAGDEKSEAKIEIGRMKVTLMPEYDGSGLIVIKEGKFADKSQFPRKVTFNIPKGVKKITDVCSLSPGGQHFCQLFDITPGETRNILDVKLPYSDFFIDFKYSPFKVAENSTRTFTYDVTSKYDIKTLEVNIQKPARAEKFTIDPPTGNTYDKTGYEYHKYVLKNVKAGEITSFNVSYYKADIAPSVSVKFKAMGDNKIFDGLIAEILLGAGVLGLLVVVVWRRKKSKGNL